MRKLALALPVLSLLLQLDRLLPGRAPPPRSHVASDLEEVYRALPPRNEGRLGRPGDPLNIIFLGTEARVRRALEEAGWTSLPLSWSASLREGLLQILRGERLSIFPPMNAYRVMERTQDMNWVKAVRPLRTRHHFRLWRTGIHDALGREVWWGSGNYDLSLRLWDLSHRPHPDMDLEREFLAASLQGSPRVRGLYRLPLPQVPREGRNDKGYSFRSDGRALVVELL